MPTPREVVEAWVQAFNRADAAALGELYAEDATNHQVVREPVHGRAAIRAMFEREFAAAAMTCIVENLFEDGEWAILEWRDPLGLRGCGFFRVVDGSIRLQRGYWDRLSFLRQHGLPIPDAEHESAADAVERGLVAHAAEAGIEPRNHRALSRFVHDDKGRTIGGLVGDTVWGWLQVKQLWVASAHRRKGHGSRLLQWAEDEAARRDCHHALLDTFDFQARPFYERRGYAVFGSLENFPRGHVRLFMTKALPPA
jgi:GNAT superfamily N-acetyltransferase